MVESLSNNYKFTYSTQIVCEEKSAQILINFVESYSNKDCESIH